MSYSSSQRYVRHTNPVKHVPLLPPPAGYSLQLQGLQSLEAAMTCAAVTAAERGLMESTSPKQPNSGSKATQFCGVLADSDAAAAVYYAAGQDGVGGAGPAVTVAADAAAELAGDGAWDATATIIHAGPAGRMPRIDIVEHWRRQQLHRLQEEATAATAAAAAAGPDSAVSTLEGRARESGRQSPASDRAFCLPLRLSDMLKRVLPAW
jgi:hypothetical protein